jgi:hypothetical protein
MNISKAIKLSIAGVAIVALPGLASAAIDANGDNNLTAADAIGNWTGTISGSGAMDIAGTSLPAGMTAGGAPIMDDGFMQRQITDTNTGATYIQTIIAEASGDVGANFSFGSATSAFADESWVKMESAMGGLLGKSAITEVGTAESFKTSATFQTGGFQGSSSDRSADNVALTQMVRDFSNDSNGTIDSGFAFNHGANSTSGGAANGNYEQLTLNQVVGGHDLTQLDTAGTIASLNSLTASFDYNNNVVDGATNTADEAAKSGLRLNIGVDVNSTDQLTNENATLHFAIGERAGSAAITGVDGGSYDITTSGFEQGASSVTYAAGDQIVQIYLSANIGSGGTFAKSSFNVEGESSPATKNTSTFVLSFDASTGPFGVTTDSAAGQGTSPNGTNLDPFVF